jgi:hypothetical protein
LIGGSVLPLARQRNWPYLDVTNQGTAATPVLRLIRVFRKSGVRLCDQNTRHYGMSRKSGYRFSEKIMLFNGFRAWLSRLLRRTKYPAPCGRPGRSRIRS